MPASLVLFVAIAASSASPSWRLSVEPADTAESALREAALREGAPGLEALAAVALRYPATPVSALALLTGGMRLVESRGYAEALQWLSHADLQSSLLRDHALAARGRAEEELGRHEAAAASYLAAAAEPSSAVVCPALSSAATLLVRLRKPEDAVTAIEQMIAACPRDLPDALLALGEAHLAQGDRPAAAAAFDRLDREHPGSVQARAARTRLRGLADQLPKRSAEERARLLLERGTALLGAGRAAEALTELRAVSLDALPPERAAAARVALARALIARRRVSEARRQLEAVPADSPHAAEVAYLLARQRAEQSRSPQAYEAVVERHRGTPWAEEALLALANHYQRDALESEALPWWRMLFVLHPDGRYVERAAWRVGWADYRAGRYEAAATELESTARLRPPSSYTPGFLYWAGRARLALGQDDRARRLLEETVQRYKHAYHGLRAGDALRQLAGSRRVAPAIQASGEPMEVPLPEPRASRLRQLLLVDRLEEAAQELRLLPDSSRVQATLAWIDWSRGRYRSALVMMKRAHPEWIGAAGDRLPEEVWRILFPIRYDAQLRAAADERSLDPALVAAMILQESSFDVMALSRTGARGLMQVMPATGRAIARSKGKRFRRAALHDPETSIDFGTHYLRQMSERFGGAVEQVLAAYNAGPHRVDSWTATQGERSAEEFIESIPFTETRNYVMIILASREHYRRLYGLSRSVPGPVAEGARP